MRARIDPSCEPGGGHGDGFWQTPVREATLSERELRSRLRLLLSELERRGSPFLVGAGLALAAGPEGCAALQDPPAAESGAARDAGADLPTAVAMYSAPGCSAARP